MTPVGNSDQDDFLLGRKLNGSLDLVDVHDLAQRSRRKFFRVYSDVNKIEGNLYAAFALTFTCYVGVPRAASYFLLGSGDVHYYVKLAYAVLYILIGVNISECILRYLRTPEFGNVCISDFKINEPSPSTSCEKAHIPHAPLDIIKPKVCEDSKSRRKEEFMSLGMDFLGDERMGLDYTMLDDEIRDSSFKGLEYSDSGVDLNSTQGNYILPKFRHSKKPKVRIESASRTEDGITIKNAQDTIDEWNISLHLETWTEATRAWISEKIFKSIARRIEDFESKAPCQDFEKPLDNLGDGNLAQERLRIIRYLGVPGYTCKTYILERIKYLAKTRSLAYFVWNRGSDYDGMKWSHERFPADAEIVLRVFCTFLEEKLLGPNFIALDASLFESRYIVNIGSKPDLNKKIQIRHITKDPPHYQILAERVAYDLLPGRNNLFMAISLFAYYTKIQMSGYIDFLNVSGSIGLTDIIQREPIVGKFSTNKFIHHDKKL